MLINIEVGKSFREHYMVQNIISESCFEKLHYLVDTTDQGGKYVLREFVVQNVDERAFSSFRAEVNMIQAASHKQVQEIKDSFSTESQIFVMENYIVGETYKSLQKLRRTFNEVEVTGILRQILAILSHLHQHSVAHRNIAPENIILRSSDSLPVIANFGCIKELALKHNVGELDSRLISRVKQLPIGFVSPGVGEDLYALAVTAIMLLTGKDVGALFNQQTQSWEWEESVIVSDQLGFVLNKMLAVQPLERFFSADDVLNMLDNPSATIFHSLDSFRSSNSGNSHPQTPTSEEILATGASAATATKIAAQAAASDTANPLQKASANFFVHLNKIHLQGWQKAFAGGASLLLLVTGVWFIQSKFEEPSVTINTPMTSASGSSASDRPLPSSAITEHYQLIQNKQLDESWGNLSTSFQGANLVKGLAEYKTWWNSVSQVSIANVEILENSGGRSVVKADLTYTLNSGRVMTDSKKYFYLVWDGNKWLIDGKSSEYTSPSKSP
jgi:serine/threonine protein kinase